MPKTLGGYQRIQKLHAEGDHSRCQFGCCEDNPDLREPRTYRLAGETGAELAESITTLRDGFGYATDDPRFELLTLASECAATGAGPDVFGQMVQDALWVPDGEPDFLMGLQLRKWQRELDKT